MPRWSPAPSRGTITRVSPHRRHQGDGCSEALRQGGGPAVSPSPTSRREHGMLDSKLSGKDSYIEWPTGLARAHTRARRHSLPLIDLLHLPQRRPWRTKGRRMSRLPPTFPASRDPVRPAPDVDCFICRIVAREAPASFVLEDQSTVAFVDIRQPNEGRGSARVSATGDERLGVERRSRRPGSAARALPRPA